MAGCERRAVAWSAGRQLPGSLLAGQLRGAAVLGGPVGSWPAASTVGAAGGAAGVGGPPKSTHMGAGPPRASRSSMAGAESWRARWCLLGAPCVRMPGNGQPGAQLSRPRAQWEKGCCLTAQAPNPELSMMA